MKIWQRFVYNKQCMCVHTSSMTFPKLDDSASIGVETKTERELEENGGIEEEEGEEGEGEGWWEGEVAKTLEEEAKDKGITDLFDPALLGQSAFTQGVYLQNLRHNTEKFSVDHLKIRTNFLLCAYKLN